jgi:hypothetical protein
VRTWRHLLALIEKDVRLQWRAVATFWVLQIGGIWVIAQFVPLTTPFPANRFAAFLGPLFVNSPMLIAMWLVNTERTNGTLALTRTLPVADAVVVGAKFLLGTVCQVAAFALTLVVLAPELLDAEHAPLAALLLVGLVTAGNLSLASHLVFGLRLANALPLLVLLGPMLALFWLAQRRPESNAAFAAWLLSPGGAASVCAGLAALNVAVWAATVAWFRSRETSQLVR